MQNRNNKGVLFLDLDETLIHKTFQRNSYDAIELKITGSNQIVRLVDVHP